MANQKFLLFQIIKKLLNMMVEIIIIIKTFLKRSKFLLILFSMIGRDRIFNQMVVSLLNFYSKIITDFFITKSLFLKSYSYVPNKGPPLVNFSYFSTIKKVYYFHIFRKSNPPPFNLIPLVYLAPIKVVE